MNDIEKLQPDLLFLDIEMPGMNGFEMLEKILHLNFSIIFITAYNQYALKAFRFNALDYLVKPIASIDLIEAVAKPKKR
ncbi:MAG: response regulator [Chitinophagaceae bacterium]|nr:response regulator [Chitinophagaceae bacterium]